MNENIIHLPPHTHTYTCTCTLLQQRNGTGCFSHSTRFFYLLFMERCYHLRWEIVIIFKRSKRMLWLFHRNVGLFCWHKNRMQCTVRTVMRKHSSRRTPSYTISVAAAAVVARCISIIQSFLPISPKMFARIKFVHFPRRALIFNCVCIMDMYTVFIGIRFDVSIYSIYYIPTSISWWKFTVTQVTLLWFLWSDSISLTFWFDCLHSGNMVLASVFFGRNRQTVHGGWGGVVVGVSHPDTIWLA